MDPSDTGGMGWLSSLLGGGSAGAPTSLAAPGTTAPTPDSANLPVNGTDPKAPTVMGAVNALGGAAPAIQKAMQRPAGPAAPQIAMPQPQGSPYAAALAKIMANLNAKNPQMNTQTPQGTQPS